MKSSPLSNRDAIKSVRDSSPIFIVGAPRSGTTLLQYMLRSHPRISIPAAESHFFVPLLKSQGQIPLDTPERISDQLRHLLTVRPAFFEQDMPGIVADIDEVADTIYQVGCQTIADFISNLYAINAFGEGKSRWGDKTPYYVRHIPLLLKHFPNAKFIHLVRDGRDVALSMLARANDFSVYNVYTAAQHWKYYLEPVLELGNSSQLLQIRYEDLTKEPESTVRNILAFVDEPFDPAAIDFKKVSRKKNGQQKTPLLAQSVTDANTQKWKSLLTKKQQQVFEGVAGELIEYYGYQRTVYQDGINTVEVALYKVHNMFRKSVKPNKRRLKVYTLQ